MTKRKRVVQGGTWAGKTYGILPVLADYATKNKNKLVTVTAQTIPSLRKGAIKDFKNMMRDSGRWNDARWNATELHYTFHSGTRIEFSAFDSVGKAQQAGKRDVLFINEAPYISYEIADALIIRTVDFIYIDFNPTSEFWAHTEILSNPEDSEFLLLKYTDNECLPDNILSELHIKLSKAFYDPDGDHADPSNIKSEYWRNWCRVYIDGEIGTLQGAVYTDWEIIDNIPKEARLLGNGMDFGFTSDPTAQVAFYKYNDCVVLDELLYQTGLVNAQIYNQTKSNPGQTSADSAEPKTIRELQLLGMDVIGVEKGADSLKYGIQLLQGVKILVTARSVNIISELRKYCWEKDRDGKYTKKPIDDFNHALDAARYAAMRFLVERSTGVGGAF